MKDTSLSVIGSDKMNEIIARYEDSATVWVGKPEGFEGTDLVEDIEIEFDLLNTRVYIDNSALHEEIHDLLGAAATDGDLERSWYE